MESIIKFSNVSKVFGKTNALTNSSFCIQRFDFIALVGNNGCGKTTTINLMCNILQTTNGFIEAFGKKVTPNYVSFKNKLGIVLSKPYFIEEFTINEYLKFVCKFQHVPNKEISTRLNDLMELFDLKEYMAIKIMNLSSGNQMKVNLCAALIHNPEFLILDEPFINIDIKITERIIKILKSFSKKKTIFITSHNLDLVTDLCDRFIIMESGSIVLDLQKSEFSSIDELKVKIKETLAGDISLKNISWLY